MDLRYYFCENSNANLVDFLKSKKIKYKDTGVATGSPLIVFNIRSSDKNYEETLNSLRELGVREPLLFAEYSSSEYDNAKLLVMRPKKQKIEITSEDAYRYSCRWSIPLVKSWSDTKNKSAHWPLLKNPLPVRLLHFGAKIPVFP